MSGLPFLFSVSEQPDFQDARRARKLHWGIKSHKFCQNEVIQKFWNLSNPAPYQYNSFQSEVRSLHNKTYFAQLLHNQSMFTLIFHLFLTWTEVTTVWCEVLLLLLWSHLTNGWSEAKIKGRLIAARKNRFIHKYINSFQLNFLFQAFNKCAAE